MFISTNQNNNIDSVARPTFGTYVAPTPTSNNPRLNIGISSNNFKLNDIIEVTVNVNTDTVSITEYKLNIKYDTTKLEYVNGSFAYQDGIFAKKSSSTDISTGNIMLNSIGTSNAVNKTVLKFNLKAKSVGDASITKVIADTYVINAQGSKINLDSNSVNLNIANTNAVSTTTVTAQTTVNINPKMPTTSVDDIYFQGSFIFLGVIVLFVGIWMILKDSKKDFESTWK